MCKNNASSDDFNSPKASHSAIVSDLQLILLSTVTQSDQAGKWTAMHYPITVYALGMQQNLQPLFSQSSEFYFKFQERSIGHNHLSDEATYGRIYKFPTKFIHMHPKVGNSIQFLWFWGIFLAISSTKNHRIIAEDSIFYSMQITNT